MNNDMCYGCFRETLDENGICTTCGFDAGVNKEKYPLALPAGSILNGRYVIGKVLGQGGFGITYLAQDYQTKELVAIKEYFPDAMATRTNMTRVMPLTGERGDNFNYGLISFLDEAKTMAEFNENPNVVSVLVYFEENGTGYYVMEYVDGSSFEAYIKAHGGRISWDETMKIMLPVLEALDAVHKKGIIHRDVTPDNIFVTSDGTVKLLDFGAARHNLGNVSRSLDVILKHGFAPKEQYSRRGRQSTYTDVYAASATIYYAITGAKPDDAIERSTEDTMPMPSNLGVKITPQQEDVLMKGLAVEAPDRYQTAAEMKKALEDSDALIAVVTTPVAERKSQVVPVSPPKMKIRRDPVSSNTPEVEAEKKQKKTLFGLTGKRKRQVTAAAVVVILLVGFLLFWFLHPHFYGEWVTIQEATCLDENIRERICFCGEVEKEITPALGHTQITDHAVAPTCTESGMSEGSHCSVCNEVLIEQHTVPATGHSVVTLQVVEPTCTETGLTEGIGCANCDYAEVPQVSIEALGHTPVVDEAVEMTCTVDGRTEGSHCEVCDEILVEQVITPAPGHTEVKDWGRTVTCTADGLSDGSHCSVCEEVIVERTVTHKKLGHNFSSGVCTRCGAHDKVTCSSCGGSGKCSSCRSNPGWCSACDGMGAWYEIDLYGNSVLKICGTCHDGWYCTRCGGSAKCRTCGGAGVV